MKKIVLFTAKVDQHIINFHLPYLKYFKEKGYDVHVACHGEKEIPYADKVYQLPLIQSPTNIKKVQTAYRVLKQITKENEYQLVHCHTPVIGVLTRLATIPLRKQGTKVLYTAHGFHFYRGAPLSHWLLYFPAEKFLSKYTDVLITINQEDYDNTVKYHFKAKEVQLIPGVGVDLKAYSPQAFPDKKTLRQKHNFNESDFILLYVAELNKNKNQELLIEMMETVAEELPEVKLLLVGDGEEADAYKALVQKKNLERNIKFLGFREDVGELLKLADVSVSASKREGLPVNILEAMAMKKPLIVTNVRGNRELVSDEENGFLINDLKELIVAVLILYRFEDAWLNYGNVSREKVNNYSLETILTKMKNLYDKELMNSH